MWGPMGQGGLLSVTSSARWMLKGPKSTRGQSLQLTHRSLLRRKYPLVPWTTCTWSSRLARKTRIPENVFSAIPLWAISGAREIISMILAPGSSPALRVVPQQAQVSCAFSLAPCVVKIATYCGGPWRALRLSQAPPTILRRNKKKKKKGTES